MRWLILETSLSNQLLAPILTVGPSLQLGTNAQKTQ